MNQLMKYQYFEFVVRQMKLSGNKYKFYLTMISGDEYFGVYLVTKDVPLVLGNLVAQVAGDQITRVRSQDPKIDDEMFCDLNDALTESATAEFMAMKPELKYFYYKSWVPVPKCDAFGKYEDTWESQGNSFRNK